MTWLFSVSELELSSYAVVRGRVFCVKSTAFEATTAECVLLNVSENEPWLSDVLELRVVQGKLALLAAPWLSYKPG